MNHPSGDVKNRDLVIRSSFFLFLLLLCSGAGATVLQPNGEYQDSMDDLSVKVPGGHVTVSRTWQADNLNQGQFRWYFNPSWADLSFTYDSIDGSVKQITRASSTFTLAGAGVYVFDKIWFIKQTSSPAGWRWYDSLGNWITYDVAGKITAYGNRNNVGVSFTRNSDGTINQLKDQNGKVVLTYSYSGGQVSKIADANGRSVSYQFSGGQLKQVTDALGYNWTYDYTGGLLTGRTDANGNKTQIAYSGNRVVQITDPMGYQTNYTYAYDHFARVYTTVEVSPTNVRTETHYNANGTLIYKQIGTRVVNQVALSGTNVAYSTDERGLQTKTVYDSLHNPIQIVHPDGTTTSATYSTVNNLVTSRTDELGIRTQYQYDANGNLTQLTEAVGYPEQRTTVYTYDSNGQRLTQTVKGLPIPAGVTPGPNDTQYQDATTTWTYDTSGNAATVADPLGNTTTLTYDAIGNLQTRLDANGNTMTFTHNANGWLTSQIDALGNTTVFGYDKVGNQTSVTDALRNSVSYVYTANNWRKTFTDQLGGSSSYGYNNQGQLTQSTDASGVNTIIAYDSDGRKTSTTDAAGNVVTLQYGSAANGLSGLIAAVVLPTYTEQYKYDSNGRRTQRIKILPGVNGQPSQQIIYATGYDAKGRVISKTDPLGNTTLIAYDALGRIVQVTDALAATTKYTYDSRNNVLSIADGNGNVHKYSYDLASRKVAESSPMGGVITYAYDSVGRATTQTSANGERRVYLYDAAGRLKSENLYPANSATASQTVSYVYDARNQLASYAQTGDTQSSATYTYDAKGEKTKETVTYGSGQNAFSQSLGYDYYPNGLKKDFTYPDGSVVSYGYTANNLLASATEPDGSTVQFTGFVWNTPTQVQLPGVVRNITLDPLQRPLEIKVQAIGAGTTTAPGGAVVMDYRYTYDATGNVVKRITEDGEYDYAYDKLNQLTGATPPANLQASQTNPNGLPVEQYTYDAAHNRISSAHQPGAWSYDADNRLTTYGSAAQQQSFSYDTNGNAVQQLTGNPGTPSNTRKFVYNAAARVVEVDDNASVVATYQYDPIGRRINKQIGGRTIWYQYSDEGLVAEYTQGGAITRIYGWKPGGVWGGDPIWMADRSGQDWVVQNYTNDILGTSQRTTNSAGAATWKGASEGFGNVIVDSSSTVANNLRFPGQYFDAETELSDNHFRSYDARVGRYLQRDPLGFAAGVNFYTYVTNQPLAEIDPDGLTTWKGHGGTLSYTGGAGLEGGVTVGTWNLRTECENGKQGHVVVFAFGDTLGLGLGLFKGKIPGRVGEVVEAADEIGDSIGGIGGVLGPGHVNGSVGREDAEFETSDVDPNEFSGSFLNASGGITFGIGGGCDATKLGQATGHDCGVRFGLDIGISGTAGVSMVVSSDVKKCHCVFKE